MGQQEAEAAAPDTRAPATPAMGTCAPIDIEVGVNGCQSAATATDAPTGLSQEQVQAQSQMQAVAFNDSIIREREEDIANIHRTVQEVSEIFQDLALLVDEQGTHIDNIQTNIESAARQTGKGVQQLASASRSQRKNRSRMCCLAMVLIFFLIALILVLKFAMHLL